MQFQYSVGTPVHNFSTVWAPQYIKYSVGNPAHNVLSPAYFAKSFFFQINSMYIVYLRYLDKPRTGIKEKIGLWLI